MFKVQQFDQALRNLQPPGSLQEYCRAEFPPLVGEEKLYRIAGDGWPVILEIYTRAVEHNWPLADAQALLLHIQRQYVPMREFIEATCTMPLRKRQLLERFGSNVERNAQQFGTFLEMEFFCNLPVSWGSIFQDDSGCFWATLRLRCKMAKPAGDLGQRPVLAWEAMTRAGVPIDAFLAALEAAHVGVYNQCVRSLEARTASTTPRAEMNAVVPANVQWTPFWKTERQKLLRTLTLYLPHWKQYHQLNALGFFPQPQQENIMGAVHFLDNILGVPKYTATFVNAVETPQLSVDFWDAMRDEFQ